MDGVRFFIVIKAAQIPLCFLLNGLSLSADGGEGLVALEDGNSCALKHVSRLIGYTLTK